MAIDADTKKLALLSMDAYNEGFFERVKLLGNDNEAQTLKALYDNKTISFTALGLSDKQQDDWQKHGFSATVYESDGRYIISYRGTNDPVNLAGSGASDVWNGYGLGVGCTSSPQAYAAVDLYKAVLAESA